MDKRDQMMNIRREHEKSHRAEIAPQNILFKEYFAKFFPEIVILESDPKATIFLEGDQTPKEDFCDIYSINTYLAEAFAYISGTEFEDGLMKYESDQDVKEAIDVFLKQKQIPKGSRLFIDTIQGVVKVFPAIA